VFKEERTKVYNFSMRLWGKINKRQRKNGFIKNYSKNIMFLCRSRWERILKGENKQKNERERIGKGE
jgi:hypothetical protein